MIVTVKENLLQKLNGGELGVGLIEIASLDRHEGRVLVGQTCEPLPQLNLPELTLGILVFVWIGVWLGRHLVWDEALRRDVKIGLRWLVCAGSCRFAEVRAGSRRRRVQRPKDCSQAPSLQTAQQPVHKRTSPIIKGLVQKFQVPT